MNYRALLIRIATFLGGIYFFLNFVLPADWFATPLESYDERIKLGFTIVGSMAFALGLINVFMVHGSRVVFLRKGWFNSVALLIGFVGMAFVTYLDWRDNDRIAERAGIFSTYRDFSEQIGKDLTENKPNIPAVPFRAQKLAEALEVALASVHAEVGRIQREGQVDAGHPDALVLQSSIGDLTSALEAVTRENMHLREALASDKDPVVGILSALSQLANPLQDLSSAYRAVLLTEYRHTGSAHLYQLLFQGLAIPLGTAMFALLGFYIATAAYRAFRIRSAESGLMLFAALLVMLGQIPFGIWLWGGFPSVRNWLLTVPSGGARLAIEIGVSVAGLIMAFRMWLSVESESFSAKKK